MSWIDDTIDTFGRSMGVPHLRLDQQGELHLALPGGALLGVLNLGDAQPPEMLVYRSEPLHHAPGRKLRRALRLADFRQPRTWPLQVGVQDDALHLALRIAQRRFTLDTLEQALSELRQLHAGLDGRA